MKRVLCIDGGGMRGYLPVAVLAELEAQTGRRCCDLFDAIWGTSIGGIAAGLLGTGMPAREVLSFFTEDGPRIFRRRWWRYFGLLGPRYAAAPIEAVLRARFAGREPLTRIAMPAFDLVTQAPYFFKFSPYLNYVDGLWRAARATSSAQIYFPAFATTLPDGPHIFWDGGNVANNPALCAYADAFHAWPTQRITILSLGCGVLRVERRRTLASARRLIDAPAWRNGLATVATLFEADSEEVDYQLGEILGRNYVRFQPRLEQALPLDGADPEALANLKNAAANAVRAAQPFLDRFLHPHETRS